MSVNRVEAFTVSCSRPDCEAETGLHWHHADAIDEAYDKGWEKDKHDNWVCPECSGCFKPDVEGALRLIKKFGGVDGAHHKQWVLDRVVSALTGKKYAKWVKSYRGKWDTGIAP